MRWLSRDTWMPRESMRRIVVMLVVARVGSVFRRSKGVIHCSGLPWRRAAQQGGILADCLEKSIRDSGKSSRLRRGDMCLATPVSPNASLFSWNG